MQRTYTDATSRGIRGEYSEMPGLLLTLAQAQRLWVLEGAAHCEALFWATPLVAEEFTSDGRCGAPHMRHDVSPRRLSDLTHRRVREQTSGDGRKQDVLSG